MPEVGLTQSIGKESPVVFFKREFHSGDKIDIFYWSIAFLFLILFFVLLDILLGIAVGILVFGISLRWYFMLALAH